MAQEIKKLMGQETKKKTKEDRKRLKLGCAPEFPDNIFLDEILTRVSWKSLSQYKSVSRGWYTSLSDPDFFRVFHIKNPSDECLIVGRADVISMVTGNNKECYILNLENIHLIGCLNGMIVINRGKVLCLWNQFTGNSLEFDLPNGAISRIGGGYVVGADVYKIVIVKDGKTLMKAITGVNNSGNNEGNNSGNNEDNNSGYNAAKGKFWCSLKTIDLVDDDDEGKGVLKIPQTIIKNHPVWVDKKVNTHTEMPIFNITQFDVLTNSFRSLTPFCPSQFDDNVRFVSLKDELTALVYDINRHTLNIFGMNEEGIGRTWQVMSTFEMKIPPASSMFQGLGDRLLVEENGKVLSYDRFSQKLELISETLSSPLVGCFSHQPGIASISLMKSVHLMNQHGDDPMLKSPRRLIDSLRGRRSRSRADL